MVVLVLKYQEKRTLYLMLGSAVSIAVMLFPPFYVLENTNLTVRMIADILLFVYAIMFGYALEKYATTKMASRTEFSFGFRAFKILSRLNSKTRGLIFAFLIPTFLVSYWNFPPTFDSTVQNIFLRYTSDLSYLGAAIFTGLALVHVPKKFRVLLLFFAFMCVGMMGSMMLVWTPGFYTVYTSVQNTDMNTFMMLFGAFGIIGTSSYLLKVMDVV